MDSTGRGGMVDSTGRGGMMDSTGSGGMANAIMERRKRMIAARKSQAG